MMLVLGGAVPRGETHGRTKMATTLQQEARKIVKAYRKGANIEPMERAWLERAIAEGADDSAIESVEIAIEGGEYGECDIDEFWLHIAGLLAE